MIPILFNYNATTFTTHGIGDLMETIRCESIATAEGEYELELDYPAGGEFIDSLIINNIIYAKVNDHGNWQAFRIYGVDKAINNLVTVHAQHISYDLAGVVVKAYETTTCSAAISGLKTNAVGSDASAYTITTNIPNSQQALNQDHKFKLEEPTTLRAALLDGDDSIKGCWGGDLIFDNYTIQLQSVGGADRGVLVEYGIDLIDMEQEENISEMITGVYPYWKGTEKSTDESVQNEEIIVYGDVQYATGTFKKHRIQPLNVAEYYPNNDYAPTKAQINQTARDWIVANEIGQPQINLTLSYAEVGKDVRLYDAITVRFVNIGIDVGAKVVSYTYDVLKERCIEVEVGNVKPSILFSLEDASRLKRGLIPPARIQNNSITEDKLGNGSVGGSQIKSDSLSSYHLTDSAVTNSKIGGGAVSTSKIADSAVTTEKVDHWAITTDKIGEMAVTTAKIKDGDVTSGKISDNAVITGKIANGAVVEAKIGNSAITSAKIQNGAVIEAKVGDAAISTRTVQDLAIDSAKIGNSAITSVKIQDAAVVEAKVHNAAITTQKVADLAIDQAKIGNSAITSVKIQNGAVVDGKIGNYAVNYENIKDAEIDQLKLNDYCITSEKIGQGTWHTEPDGTRRYVSEAVVHGTIGDYQVYDIKLTRNAQDAIVAVWEIQNLTADYGYIKTLVTNNINADGISASYGYIGSLSAGSVSTSSLYLAGDYVGKISVDTSSGYIYSVYG